MGTVSRRLEACEVDELVFAIVSYATYHKRTSPRDLMTLDRVETLFIEYENSSLLYLRWGRDTVWKLR